MVETIIRQASVEDKKVFIHYRKGNGGLSERVIGGIIPSEEYGEGYIEAFCYKQNDNRTFRIDRILDARIIDEQDFVPIRLNAAPLISIEPQPHKDIAMPIIQNDNNERKNNAQVVYPIISNGDTIGTVILMSKEANKKMDEVEKKVAQSAAAFLGSQMDI